jgi:DNA-binding response OmpR family regulator
MEGGEMVQSDFDRRRPERDEAARERRKRLVPWKRGPTILLVEDDPDMREMLAGVLRRQGCSVIEAADGEEAIDWLGIEILDGDPRRVPDLIVSDICLPYLSGLELLEGARLAPKPIPVVLITGFGDVATHDRARDLGAVCVLDKPFAMHELCAAVRQALRPRVRRPPWERDGHVI